MPNHLHGILVLADAPSENLDHDPTCRKPLGRLIAAFKTVSSKAINQLRDTPGAQIWQRNYYEHIVRSEDRLRKIQQYIVTNPARWHEDDLYTQSPPAPRW